MRATKYEGENVEERKKSFHKTLPGKEVIFLLAGVQSTKDGKDGLETTIDIQGSIAEMAAMLVGAADQDEVVKLTITTAARMIGGEPGRFLRRMKIAQFVVGILIVVNVIVLILRLV